jgi:hypothetical protein
LVGANLLTLSSPTDTLLERINRRITITGSETFTLTSGTFSLGAPHWSHEVTDFRVTAVPEPASWAMLIAGFGLVGGTMRHRRMVHVNA